MNELIDRPNCDQHAAPGVATGGSGASWLCTLRRVLSNWFWNQLLQSHPGRRRVSRTPRSGQP